MSQYGNYQNSEFMEGCIKREKKIGEFKAELKTLMAKYNFGKEESLCYDGEDEYAGTTYHFTIDGEAYHETIVDIIEDVMGTITD